MLSVVRACVLCAHLSESCLKHDNSVIIYSPLCRSKPVCCCLCMERKRRIFEESRNLIKHSMIDFCILSWWTGQIKHFIHWKSQSRFRLFPNSDLHLVTAQNQWVFDINNFKLCHTILKSEHEQNMIMTISVFSSQKKAVLWLQKSYRLFYGAMVAMNFCFMEKSSLKNLTTASRLATTWWQIFGNFGMNCSFIRIEAFIYLTVCQLLSNFPLSDNKGFLGKGHEGGFSMRKYRRPGVWG